MYLIKLSGIVSDKWALEQFREGTRELSEYCKASLQ